MTSNIENGQVIEGKVTGIQPYGAFISLNSKTQGLVHISEITNGYVKNIHDHLSIGDEVKVKVLEVSEEQNKISLSIRATESKPTTTETSNESNNANAAEDHAVGFHTLKEKLQEWIDQSENR